MVFNHWLLLIQKGLLRLYFHIKLFKSPQEIDKVKDAKDNAGEVGEILSKRKIIREAEGRESLSPRAEQLSPYREACRLLTKAFRPLENVTTPYELNPEEFWEKFSQGASFDYEILMENAEELRDSFRLIAQAIDTMRTVPTTKPRAEKVQ